MNSVILRALGIGVLGAAFALGIAAFAADRSPNEITQTLNEMQTTLGDGMHGRPNPVR